jgi:hypothetical protein
MPAGKSKQAAFFEKKRAKNFCSVSKPVSTPGPRLTNVFCCFFQKSSAFLPFFLPPIASQILFDGRFDPA